MKVQFTRVLARVVVVLAIAALLPAAARAMHVAASVAPPARSAAAGITYAANTVVVPRSVVDSQLISIDPGGVYTFHSASGLLAQLKPGKVVVLQGIGAGVVTAAQTQGGQFVVHATDPKIGQVIRSGTIDYDFTPDFGQTITAPFDVPDDESSSDTTRPALSIEPGAVSDPVARPAAGSLSIQGSRGKWGYSITGSPSGPGKLDLSGQICLGDSGSECGNGPSLETAVEIGFSGTLDLNKIRGDVEVSNGTVAAAKTVFSNVTSSLKMNYTFSRGEGGFQARFPPLHIPIGWDIPIPTAPVPMFVRVQFAALLQVLTRPAKNTVTHGGLDTTYSGTATSAGSDSGTSNGGSGDKASGTVNAGGSHTGISLANLGVDVTFQEKAGIALGVSVANLMGFTDFTSTIGQEQASAIAGGFCSSYIGVSDWGVGLAGELGSPILGAHAEIRKSLVQKKYYFTEPGCKPISG